MGGRYIAEADALSHVAGYCVVNDVSEREFQLERGGTWDKGKGNDTFGPIGPWLVTADEVPDPHALRLWLEVDGHRYQNGTTATMVFRVPHLISYLSRFMSLQPGDVISTGTPPGVGLGQKPPVYLRAGQVITLGIDGRRATPAHRAGLISFNGRFVMPIIRSMRVLDVRFPTSRQLDGSDAMNPDPDYSAAYVVLETDHDGPKVTATFTIGRGNEICCAAIDAMRHLVVGLDLDWIREDMGRFWRHVTSDSQLRWIGPDKGAIHLATGAVVNAVWDLWAKAERKPLWRLVADMARSWCARSTSVT